jgi:hypothetical protein
MAVEVTRGPLEGIRGILLRKGKRHRRRCRSRLSCRKCKVRSSASEKVTIKQIAETVQKIIGNVKIEYVPARPGDFPGKEVSSQLAKTELGWEPKIAFEEGVKRYVEWYQARAAKAAPTGSVWIKS